tara:strand:+ start:7 stop:1278 length:1272 start_codon:yes stop_codon:yes gene_type:complete
MRVCTGLLILLWIAPRSYAQCDLELLDFDVDEGTITVAFNSTQNCGGTGGPDGVSEIQFGFQALDGDCNAMNIGWDFPSGVSIPDDSNHPGWVYSATTTETPSNWTNSYDESVDPPYYAGDTVSFPVYNVYNVSSGGVWYQMEDILNFWIDEGYSIQVVIWQISYGPTMYAAEGGWAEVGVNGDGTPWGVGLYEDGNFLDNWVVVGPCEDCVPEVVTDTVYVELPPDTVVEYDTIPVPINWYFYDTTYIYLTDTLVEVDTVYVTDYLTDTIYENEYVYDTVWVDQYIYDTTYVYILDTILSTEYVYDTVPTYEYDLVGVECDTGLPCVDPIPDCPIYIPNAFTPDNDGTNDVWGAETNASCWSTWLLRVYSRYGDVVWESEDPGDVWLGGDEYYVPSDVYNYQLQCSMPGSSYIINGHVTIVR